MAVHKLLHRNDLIERVALALEHERVALVAFAVNLSHVGQRRQTAIGNETETRRHHLALVQTIKEHNV